jgi:hypothetical protein
MEIRARVVARAKIDSEKSVVLSREKLHGADFSGRRLEHFSSEASRLEACRFDKVRIESASFGAGRAPSEYLECSFDGARIRFGPGGFARFVRCSFRDVDLRDWFCFALSRSRHGMDETEASVQVDMARSSTSRGDYSEMLEHPVHATDSQRQPRGP